MYRIENVYGVYDLTQIWCLAGESKIKIARHWNNEIPLRIMESKGTVRFPVLIPLAFKGQHSPGEYLQGMVAGNINKFFSGEVLLANGPHEFKLGNKF